MDKILVPIAAGPKNKHINVTNDGATILRSMHVDNPAAKILNLNIKNSRLISW
jgi:chaperonin GroEL (HSP60 family)